MNTLFLDTGYLIALEALDDQNHDQAQRHWREVKSTVPLMTTSFVFDEVVTFLNTRNRHAKAEEVGHRLLTSSRVELVHVDDELLRAGWDYLAQRSDKRYSLTDCVSFVVMQQSGITAALTFDRHFEQAGFRTLP